MDQTEVDPLYEFLVSSIEGRDVLVVDEGKEATGRAVAILPPTRHAPTMVLVEWHGTDGLRRRSAVDPSACRVQPRKEPHTTKRISSFTSMDAGGEPGTVGDRIQKWLEGYGEAIRSAPHADPSIWHVQYHNASDDTTIVTVWRRRMLTAFAISVRDEMNWCAGATVVLRWPQEISPTS